VNFEFDKKKGYWYVEDEHFKCCSCENRIKAGETIKAIKRVPVGEIESTEFSGEVLCMSCDNKHTIGRTAIVR